MNIKIKILMSVITVAVVIILNCAVVINSVKAANIAQITHVDLHYGGICEPLLKYKGVIVKTSYVEYYGEDGKNYPAYCMDKDLPRCYRQVRVYCNNK